MTYAERIIILQNERTALEQSIKIVEQFKLIEVFSI